MKRLILTICACVLFTSTVALGDWDLSDPHKWVQLPDEEGWDVKATHPKVLADDWQCPWTGWVDDIHWWGSWKGGEVGTITSFALSIHANIADGGDGYSIPGGLLWGGQFTADAIEIDSSTCQGWYDPDDETSIVDDHQAYFQYNLFLPEADWFWQEEGTIYWLSISAVVTETDKEWGWKTSDDHWNDDAVYGHYATASSTLLNDWIEMYDPLNSAVSLDMAFVITPEPATLVLLGFGSLALLRKKRRA